MSKKNLYIIGLIIPVLFFVGWIASLELSMYNKPHVVIAVRGYDPRDLISGHYLRLQLDWSKTDCSQFEDNICPKNKFDWTYRYYVPEHEALPLERKLVSGKYDAYLHFIMFDNRKPQIVDFQIKEIDKE